MPKKLHPSELAEIDRQKQARSFNVHFRKSADEKFNLPAATEAEAQELAASLDAEHGQFGRRAMIYGLLDDGSRVAMPRRTPASVAA